jgi:aspartyl-tRNA(Asn)/glutamyl-tRNA(Gln) amidotransferase subunit A
MPPIPTIAEAAQQIRERKLTPTQLVDAALAQTDKYEPAIHAWATLNPKAREEAEALTREAEAGRIRGPLHGVPVGAKDIYDTADIPTSYGSPLYAGHIPSEDCALVAQLKAAGAIILGKTHTTEFAYLDPAPTRNPWNTEHTPGGSSSGSAAAVAAKMVPVALGSQTGGSITRPASYCGVVGFKPTHGALSLAGVHPLSWSMDHAGYLTRTAEDAELVWDVLTGDKPYEATRRPRVALPEGFFMDAAEEQVRVGFDECLQRIYNAGCEVTPVKLPDSFPQAQAAARVTMFAETAAVHRVNYLKNPMSFRSNLRGMIAAGLLIQAPTYINAQRIRSRFQREMTALMKDYDAVITPSCPTAALKGLESTGDASFNLPWSFLGYPTITMPTGVTWDMLPVGAQLASLPNTEPQLLAAAKWIEKRLGSIGEPPLLR